MEKGWQKFYMRSSVILRYDPRYCIYFSNIYIIGVSILEYFVLQIVAVTTENASNNKTMMQILANKLRRYNKFFTASGQVLCFAHIMNVVVQASMKTFNVRPEIQDEVNAFEDTPLTLNVNDFVWTDPANVHSEDDEEGSGEDEDGESSKDDLVPDEDTQEPVHDDTLHSSLPSSPPLHPSIYLSDIVEKVRILIRETRIGKQRQRLYKTLCIEEKVSTNVLPLDCPTRWNSTFVMLDAALDKRCVLEKGVSHFKTRGKETKISDDEWTVLEIFLDILQPFAFATESVSSSRHQTISDILTMVEVYNERHLTVFESHFIFCHYLIRTIFVSGPHEALDRYRDEESKVNAL